MRNESQERSVSDSAGAGDAGFLNEKQIDNFRRVGLLQEAVGDFSDSFRTRRAILGEAVRSGRRTTVIDQLHALLGMSGEIGAQRLHQYIRAAYVPLVKEHSPLPSDEWLDELDRVATRSYGALLQAAIVSAA